MGKNEVPKPETKTPETKKKPEREKPSKSKEKGEKTKQALEEKEKDKEKKGCFTCKRVACSCLVLLFLITLVPLYAATAAGVIQVPGLTPLVYGDGPEPTREVEPADVSPTAVQEKIGRAVKNDRRKVTFSEEELTALVGKQKGMEDVNVVIEEGEAEFFGTIPDSPVKSPITVSYDINIKDHQPKIDFKKVKVGQLVVPSWGVDFATKKALEKYHKQFEDTFQYVEKIELEKKKMIIRAQWKEMIKEQMKKQQQDQKKQPMPQDKKPVQPNIETEFGK